MAFAQVLHSEALYHNKNKQRKVDLKCIPACYKKQTKQQEQKVNPTSHDE